MSRGRFLKVRVSDSELADIRARAFEAEMTVSDFLRFRMMHYRLRQTRADKERLRQLARIGSNINQLARWANTHKAAGPALEVVLWLNRLMREVTDIWCLSSSAKDSFDALGIPALGRHSFSGVTWASCAAVRTAAAPPGRGG